MNFQTPPVQQGVSSLSSLFGESRVNKNPSTTFQPNLQLGETSELALHSLQMWNSLPNISLSRNNNKFRFYNGSTWSAIITIPNGNYSVEDLNLTIQGLITTAGGVGSNIVLVPNLIP